MSGPAVDRAVRLAGLCAIVAVLAGVAWLSPQPDRVTDRDIYETTARQTIVPDCTDLHCFRVLVSWTLGAIPGPSIVKWKSYAVVSNAAAVVAVFLLCGAWGLSARAALMAAVATATGFGSFYTLHDVFTSDPLMYALGPLVVLLLVREHVALSGVVAVIGVLAKEFVAAPLFIVAVARWWEGRRALALRVLVAANAAFLAWLILQLTLILRFNYGYGDNPSTHLLSGGYLLPWIAKLSPRGAMSALFNEYGALWLLAPAGLFFASAPMRRLAALSLPVAAIFAYVQQPDRALWNFHFLVTPLAALVLERAPAALAWATLGAFAFANLRIGAQLPGIPAARFALALSVVLAAVSVAWCWRAGVTAPPGRSEAAAHA